MATTADFLGKNCPHCGAIDSLQADEALGEVACVECALVVAMGLEENALTRYNKDATYDDVDQHREDEHENVNASAFVDRSSSLSGTISSTLATNTLAKITLHPVMLNCIRSLQKKSEVPEMTIVRAVHIAKQFVGGRRTRGQRIEKQQDVAAACFMIAAEQMNHPVPLAELRCLDTTLGDVEYRRAEIVKETQMQEEECRLKTVFVDNLLTTYLRKLGLQLSLYMPHCKRILEAFQRVDRITKVGTVERIVMAVLLTQTTQGFQCKGKSAPLSVIGCSTTDPSRAVETIYANFAAKAHLDISKVKKMMQTATENQKTILEAFESVTSSTNITDSDDDEKSKKLTPGTKRVKVEKV